MGFNFTHSLHSLVMDKTAMLHKIRRLSPNNDELELCNEALQCMENDGIIALPTDTVYGLATLSKSLLGISRIYQIKGRESSKPCAICVSDIPDILKWAELPKSVTLNLLHDLLPGPVTILLKPKQDINEHLSLNELVGIRIPVNNLIRNICRLSNVPLALTSANISNHESSLQIEEFKSLWPEIDLIIDGGRITLNENMRLGSTVVDLSCLGLYKIVRKGCAFDETTKILKSYGLLNKDI